MLRYQVNERKQAESTELSRFPPPCADFAGSVPRAQVAFLSEPIVRDDPWHHINLLCISALTSAGAFAKVVSYTCKDSIQSPECLAYWSRWLKLTPKTQARFLAICSSGRKVSLGRKLQICKFGGFLKLENFNPISKFTYLKASSSRFGILAKAMQWCSKRLIFYAYKVKNHLNLSWWGGWT